MKKPNISLNTWDWADLEKTRSNHHLLLPQASAAIASLPLVANPDGLISSKQTIHAWRDLTVKGTVQHNGEAITWTTLGSVVNYLRTTPRGSILAAKQTGVGGVRWCAGVPLILAAHKEYNSVPYSRWDLTDPHLVHLMDPDTWGFVGVGSCPFTREELVEARNQALVVKSGARSGTRREPVSTANAYNLEDPRWREVPRLVKLCWLQLWCWTPGVVSPYMIQSVDNWDVCQPPLVDDQVVAVSSPTLENPWL